MKKILTPLVVCCAFAASNATAGKIERACKASDRSAASSSLCKCIQKAANSTLTRTDRKLAAKFFADPDLAQETRQADDSRKEAFWKRYKLFSAHASKACR